MPKFMDVHHGMHGVTPEALKVAHQADLDIQDEENVDFVRGAHTLFHEAFRPGNETNDPTHTAAGKAGRLAAAAEVQRLVLIHIDPALDEDDALVQQAREYFASTEIGCDGAAFST